MLEYFHDTAFQGIENITFACNPCRISFYGKEIVVSRYDYLKRIKKNSYYLGGDLESEGEDANEVDDITKIANTILSQASLMPLFYLVQPIYWEYAEVLNLNNCPDYLILADTCEQYSLDSLPNAATKVTNPGNFSTNHTFTIVYPLLGKIELSSLPEEE